MKMAEKAENKNAKDEKKNDAGEKQKEELEEKESEGEQEYELMPDWFIKEYNEAWAKAEAEHQGAQLSMVRRWEEVWGGQCRALRRSVECARLLTQKNSPSLW